MHVFIDNEKTTAAQMTATKKEETAMKRTMKIATALAAVVWAGTATAGTFSWNVGSAVWDTTSANWSGTDTVWADGSGNEAVFNNTSSATTVTVGGARTAGAVKVGNGGNNASFTFSNGTEGSLSAASFVVQGSSDNGPNAGTALLDSLTLTTAGDIGVGRWSLVIGGSSAVYAGGVIGGGGIASSPNWGTLTIGDSATVTAVGGVNGNADAWALNLNGGTLITKSIQASDRESDFTALLTFNGTTVKPTQDSDAFVTVGNNWQSTGSAWVGDNGAVFDTDGKNIGIGVNLKPSGSGGLTKSGYGTLTLSGVNTYTGDTTVNAGTLITTGSTVLPSATDVSIASTASVTLSFSGTNTVHSLTLGGALQRRGTWGASGSGAKFTSSQLSGTGLLLVSTGSAETYAWNTGDGAWDTATANWTRWGTVWEDENDAVFNNQSGTTAITVDGARTAVVVKVGDGNNNANYTFSNGADGSLSTESFLVQGSSGNGNDAGLFSTTLDNLTLTTAGDIGVGRWSLVICGSSAVYAGGVIGGGGIVSSPNWGTLTIRDSATVTAVGGVNGNTEAWSLNLNGGTLTTKSIQASDRESDGSALLTFNGTTVKPTQDSDAFVTVGNNWQSTGSAWVGNNGAVFDTDGKNIGVGVNLKPSGSGGLTKLGIGMLTLAGSNTFVGATAVSGGTLRTPAAHSVGSGTVIVASGATWDLGLSSQTVAGLSGSGSVTRVASGGVITGNNGAALISTNKNYALLLDFGNAEGATVNGVTFTSAGTSGSGWSLNAGGLYDHDSGSGYDQLMSDFRSGVAAGVTGTLTFDNLTAGLIYNVVLYTQIGSWAGRPQNATFANGTETVQLLNTDPGTVGYYSYWFKASSSTATIAMVPLTVNTFHWFGASLEVVTNAIDLAVGDANDYAFSGTLSGLTALVKQGSGKLTLSGTNTYSGATTVSAGTLEVTAADALPSGTALEIATGTTLKLSNPGEQKVATLTFDGVPQFRGTWGGPGSGAQHTRSRFSGTGVLRVLNGETATGMMILLH